eukprot:GDKI01032383.1.p1 GENE.GDKI01032383.1~~GDKI01032383.1.p1  ORF type:complete len:233 (-),score=78.51 GDKI01032383.1:225-923(-)
MSAQLPAGKALRMVFLGAPGVGKGTYATRMSKTWSIPHISTGDIIRAEIKAGSALGKQFQDYSNSGRLVPDELVVEIAKKRLAQPDMQAGYILDGFPRTIPQAEALQKFAVGRPNLCVNLTMPDKYIILKLASRRVCADCNGTFNVADIREGEYDMPPLLPDKTKCPPAGKCTLEQRADDTEEVVTKRLAVYNVETAPLIGFYKQQGILTEFDIKKGVADLPALMQQIVKAI